MSDPGEFTFPEDAACAGHPHPEWWDLSVHRETPEQRARRHGAAKKICRQCPVRAECRAKVDPRLDEGVRGGEVLEPLGGRFGGYGAVEGIVRKAWNRRAS